MRHGFVKVAAARPHVRIGDCYANQKELTRITLDADQKGIRFLVFPELSLTSYSCADLFLSSMIVEKAARALSDYLCETAGTSLVSVVGLPFMAGSKLFNCAAVCQSGELLGLVPKTCIPTFADIPEANYFAPAPEEVVFLDFNGKSVPFGSHLLFTNTQLSAFTFGVEIGEDLLAVNPPSCDLCTGGAYLVANPAAFSDYAGASEKWALRIAAHSERTHSGYVFSNCGDGESTTDAVFTGQCFIGENGEILAQHLPTDPSADWIESEIDLEALAFERRRINTFANADLNRCLTVSFDMPLCETVLTRPVSAQPFLSSKEEKMKTQCQTILHLQTLGLKSRVLASHASKLVVGMSGGLDSTLAVLVAVRTMDLLGRSRKDVLGVTMPGFGTTDRTRSNAELLCEELGISFDSIPIGESVARHFQDIGHDPENHDVVYENAQARERTQVLMDLANGQNGLVVGTGDLSELALGWATYNGDHMSMYGVNASVPKTVIRHILLWYAEQAKTQGQKKLSEVLLDILNTPVSPELLPADPNGKIAQKTEDLVGPYELHDFFLFYMLRYGCSPEKLYRLARYAFSAEQYSDDTIKKWLRNFVRRFFSQQFKRSCSPDGPKVGPVSLSPRTGWHMPSDADASLWLEQIDQL